MENRTKYIYNEDGKHTLIIEGAQIFYKNFSGRPTEYNREGDKNFCVYIDNEELANEMINDGWNIRNTNSEEPRYYTAVKINYDNEYYVPEVYKINSRNKKELLKKDTIACLDSADIANIDILISASTNSTTCKYALKGYVKEMYVTINESRLAQKYAELESPEEDISYE